MNSLRSSEPRKFLVLILSVMLVISLAGCGSDDTAKETEMLPDSTEIATESPTEAPTEPLPQIPATMGTVITGKLNIRKGADSNYEVAGSYMEGDRIEILETKTVDGTVWGRTNRGWVGMGYVRMDGTAPDKDETDASESKLTTDGSTAILGYGVVDLGELNVRLGPDTKYGKVRTVAEGVRYAFYQRIDNWVRIEDGWVSTEYFYIEGTVADDAGTYIVKTDDLNIRTGPATSFRSTGTYAKEETIEILAQVDQWGYTEKGWVSMAYLEETIPTYSTGSATVTSGLNIRKEPNADSEMVGTYQEGDKVTIIEVQDGWGKTDKGWINLEYVKY